MTKLNEIESGFLRRITSAKESGIDFTEVREKYSVPTAIKAIKSLESQGLITIKRKTIKDRKGKSRNKPIYYATNKGEEVKGGIVQIGQRLDPETGIMIKIIAPAYCAPVSVQGNLMGSTRRRPALS